MKARLRVLLAGWLWAACAVAQAAPMLEEYRDVVARGRLSVIADIENDSLLMKRDDGFYTSGLRFSADWSLIEGGQARSWRWTVGQELYTTSDIKLQPSQIAPNDHPYAGWLYVGLRRQINEADGSWRQLGLDVGCFGPCAGGEWTQTTLHRIIRQPQPQGWSTQLGQEWGAVLHGAWAPFRSRFGRNVDLTPALHARLGNIFTDGGAELMLRAGQLNQFPQQPALFGFLRLDARAVAHNATLQGGWFSSDPGRTVNPKRGVGEAELGLTWQRDRFAITAAVTRRSNEIEGLPNSVGLQNFAVIRLLYRP